MEAFTMSALHHSIAEFIRDTHKEAARDRLEGWADEMRRSGFSNAALSYAGARIVLQLCAELPDHAAHEAALARRVRHTHRALRTVSDAFTRHIAEIEVAADRLMAHYVAPVREAKAPRFVEHPPPSQDAIDTAEMRLNAFMETLKGDGLRPRSLIRALTDLLLWNLTGDDHDLTEALGKIFYFASHFDDDISREPPRKPAVSVEYDPVIH
jgi:hypothetical protein